MDQHIPSRQRIGAFQSAYVISVSVVFTEHSVPLRQRDVLILGHPQRHSRTVNFRHLPTQYPETSCQPNRPPWLAGEGIEVQLLVIFVEVERYFHSQAH